MNKINLSKVIKDLNQLCVFLDDSFDINSGGCCYIAYKIAENLEKCGINNYSLRIYDYEYDDWDDEDIQDATEYLQDVINDKSGNSFESKNHYAIYVDGNVINGGEYEGNYTYVELDSITAEDIQWMYNFGDWNSIFEHNNCVKFGEFINLIFDLNKH